ncbi:MAG TPA: GNAT family N-acetyltransferase [Actinomycetota bacterium]|nr:GNAT family N-acetyltransferase [Actinomycetota bacterium]
MTPDVRLREVDETDLPTFFEHQRDPEANRMANFAARTREDFDRHWHAILRNGSGVVRTIESSGSVIGNVVSWAHDAERDVGYWIGREHWGRGFATAALAAFLEELPARPLYAHVAAHNLGSIRVLEKCGFERVGASSIDGVDELLFRLG